MKQLITCYVRLCVIAVHATTTGSEQCKCSRLNPSQISTLEAAFAKNIYLSRYPLMHLAKQTGLAKQQIVKWFKTRRRLIKSRKVQGTIPISKYAKKRVAISFRDGCEESTESRQMRKNTRRQPYICKKYTADIG